MISNAPTEPSIKNRLDQRMTKADLRNVRHAVYEYLSDADEDLSDFKSNAEFAANLLPYLQQVHDSWRSLRANKLWKTSEVYKHLLEYLKNLFRQKHTFLIANYNKFKKGEPSTWDQS